MITQPQLLTLLCIIAGTLISKVERAIKIQKGLLLVNFIVGWAMGVLFTMVRLGG